MPDITEVKTAAVLMQLLEDCGILRPNELEDARGLVPDTPVATMFARRLVAKGILTRWQAGQLLVGWTRLRLGNYKLCRQIGRGGFGRVFLAEHIQLQREVAVKTLSRRFTQRPEIVDQFLSEARQAAALDHRNLVHVLDVDDADEQYFVVMEYVVGRDLQRLVEQEGPLPPVQVADYLCQAADGLACAHRAGIVHRGLRPANLMLDERGEIRVLGLGMGNLAGPAELPGDEADQTVDPVKDYRAPEQRRGEHSGDTRSDIFSLGCTARYLLTGQPPEGDADHDTVADVVAADALIPAPRAFADVPSTLVELIDKMMAEIPEERFATAEDVVAALQQWLDENPEPSVCASPDVPGLASRVYGRSERARRDNDLEQAPAEGEPEQPTQRALGWLPVRALGVLAATAVACAGVAVAIYALWPPLPQPVALRTHQGSGVQEARGRAQTRPKLDVRRRTPNATAETSLPEAGAGPLADTAAEDPAPARGAAKTIDPPESPSVAAKIASDTARPKTPAKSAPKTQPAKKPSAAVPLVADNPLEQWPRAVDLPDLDASANGPLRATVAPLTLSQARQLNVTLLGGEHASAKAARFDLTANAGDASPGWTVWLHGAGESEQEAGIAIARLAVEGEQLCVAWEAAAASQSDQAACLANCVLRFTVKKHVHEVRLRTPQQVDPLSIDLTRPSLAERWPVKAVPDPRYVRFEIARLGDPFPNVYNLDPVDPITPNEADQKVLVRIGNPDLQDHVLVLELMPELRGTFRLECNVFFQVSPDVERIPMTAKKFADAADFVGAKQNNDNLMAQQVRASLARMPRQDPKRGAMERRLKQAETELAKTSAATARVQALQKMRQAMADGAPLHFRLYYLAGDLQVDLLRTALP